MSEKENLHDHYKDTCSLNSEFEKQRDKYMMVLAALLFCLFLFSIQPTETMSVVKGTIKRTFDIDIIFGTDIIQTFIWFMSLFYSIRYIQRVVCVERKYPYIHSLERELSISRESESYDNDYPEVLTYIYWIYRWLYPVIMLSIPLYKIVLEWLERANIVFLLIDTAIASIMSVCTILYIIFLHPWKRKDRIHKTTAINTNTNTH